MYVFIVYAGSVVAALLLVMMVSIIYKEETSRQIKTKTRQEARANVEKDCNDRGGHGLKSYLESENKVIYACQTYDLSGVKNVAIYHITFSKDEARDWISITNKQ